MTNFNEVTGFNKQNLNDARDKIDQALQLLKEVGLEASIGNIRYSDTEFTSKLTIKISPDNKYQKEKAKIAEDKCFDDLTAVSDNHLFMALRGKKLNINGEMLEVNDFKSRNWKMPFIVGNYKMNRKSFEKYVRSTYPEMTI